MEINKILNNIPDEKPLDIIKDDLGFTSCFRKIVVVGDSLSAGELEAKDYKAPTNWIDYEDISWGKFMARLAGTDVQVFARGGMTASEYCTTYAESKGYWDPSKAAQAYIIALGVNDLQNCHQAVGTVDDIKEDWHMNEPTFAGWYGKIIQHYKEISPNAVFFLVTMPDEQFDWRSDADKDINRQQCELLYKMAEKFTNTYVIDLYHYAPAYDMEVRKTFYVGGHLNTMGYYLTAKMIGSYIDYIVRHNMDKFSQVGFIGTPYRFIKDN